MAMESHGPGTSHDALSEPGSTTEVFAGGSVGVLDGASEWSWCGRRSVQLCHAGPLVVPVGAEWSGRCWGWWPADRVEQAFPAVLPGPVLAQVDDQSSRGRGEPAGDRDQLPADGRGGGFGVEDRDR